MKFGRFFSLVLALALVSLPAFTAENSGTGKYIVTFKPELTFSRGTTHQEVVSNLQQQLNRNLARTTKSFSLKPLQKLWIVNSVTANLTSQEVSLLQKLHHVEMVRPVVYKRWIDKDIDKKEVKQTREIQWSIAKVKAPEVWNELKIDGTGIVVGHLDTGIAAEHPLLVGKTLKFKDFTPAKKEAAYDDQGHGTHTAGSIGANSGVGVAPGVKFIVGKVFDKSGGAEDAWLLEAMQWIMDPDGNPETNDAPKLVSNSWGSDDTTDRNFWNAVQAWVDAGMVPVFAAGNNGPSGKVGTPGNFPHSWAVAATTNKDSLAYFSSVGPTVWDGVTLTKPDIAAPGQGVISCSTSGGLVSNSGTSMACPHVAGLVALMLQANPNLKIEQVRAIAEATAIDLGTPGKDIKFGSGRFDALACLKKVLETANPAATFQAYESALLTEKALVGIQANAPLSAPLARSIIVRCQSLDEGEIKSLQAFVTENCNDSAKALLNQALTNRKANEIQK